MTDYMIALRGQAPQTQPPQNLALQLAQLKGIKADREAKQFSMDQQKQLAALRGEAWSAQPEDRAAIFGKMAEIDPKAVSEMQTAIATQDQQGLLDMRNRALEKKQQWQALSALPPEQQMQALVDMGEDMPPQMKAALGEVNGVAEVPQFVAAMNKRADNFIGLLEQQMQSPAQAAEQAGMRFKAGLDANSPPKPQTVPAKLRSDFENGLISLETYEQGLRNYSRDPQSVTIAPDGTIQIGGQGLSAGAQSSRIGKLTERLDANKRVVTLIDSLVPLLDPRNVGPSGDVQQFITGVMEQGGAMAQVFGNAPKQAFADARQSAADDFDLGLLDARSVGQFNAIINALAYSIARRDNDRVTDADFNNALRQLGAEGKVPSVASMRGALEQQRLMSIDMLNSDGREYQNLTGGNPLIGFDERLNNNPFAATTQPGQVDNDAIIGNAVNSVFAE